jgi:hypothetical protein
MLATILKVVDMLFDLEDDPHEMNNLLGSNSATATDSTIGKAEHLRALLQDYLVKMGHPAAETIKMRRTSYLASPRLLGRGFVCQLSAIAQGWNEDGMASCRISD